MDNEGSTSYPGCGLSGGRPSYTAGRRQAAQRDQGAAAGAGAGSNSPGSGNNYSFYSSSRCLLLPIFFISGHWRTRSSLWRTFQLELLCIIFVPYYLSVVILKGQEHKILDLMIFSRFRLQPWLWFRVFERFYFIFIFIFAKTLKKNMLYLSRHENFLKSQRRLKTADADHSGSSNTRFNAVGDSSRQCSDP